MSQSTIFGTKPASTVKVSVVGKASGLVGAGYENTKACVLGCKDEFVAAKAIQHVLNAKAREERRAELEAIYASITTP